MISRLDHVVLTVADVEATVAFYERVLDMRRVEFGEGRVALGFGDQKLNLHEVGREIDPKARHSTAGSADLCFVASVPLAQVEAALRREGVEIEAGPVARTGALGPMRSLYFRDPDGNLLEVSEYDR